jgi:hypothetical protein
VHAATAHMHAATAFPHAATGLPHDASGLLHGAIDNRPLCPKMFFASSAKRTEWK